MHTRKNLQEKTLDTCHEEFMNDINYNEKIKIPKLLDKKKQLREEYNTNKNLTLDEKMQIKDDINDIKKQIRELNKKRDDYKINDIEINKIENFIQLLSEFNKCSRVGIIVSKNIEQALHPKNSINLSQTKFSKNNEILYSCTRKFNLDKDTFSIIFDKGLT